MEKKNQTDEKELENQSSNSSAIVDALVAIGESIQMQNDNAEKASEESGKQVAPEPEEQQQPVTVRVRKAMPPRVLRDLTLRDPKLARRIIANRMSAARAKEKKKMHVIMLENQLQALQTACNATLAQVVFVENEAQDLMDESSRLKERVTMILRRINLQDELNDQIRKEVQYLKTKIASHGLNIGKPDDGTQQ